MITSQLAKRLGVNQRRVVAIEAEDMIKEQARRCAERNLKRSSHHMALEAQSVQDKEIIEAQIETLIQEYLNQPLKYIWDE